MRSHSAFVSADRHVPLTSARNEWKEERRLKDNKD